MRVFNADPANQKLRLEAYKDEFVELVPTGTVKAIPCPDGVELHQPGGAIQTGGPGCWVRELEGGGMAILDAADVAKNFRAADDADEFDQEALETAEVAARRPDARVATVPFAGEPDPYETGHRISDDDSTEGEQSPDRTHEAVAEQQAAQEQARADSDKLTDEEKAELQNKLRSQALAAEARLQQIVATAYNAEIISQDEQHAWLATGEPPLDVIVSIDEDSGDINIRREPGHDQARRAELAAQEEEARREAEEMRNLAEQQAAEEAANSR